MAEKAYTIFDILTDISLNKTGKFRGTPEFQKTYNVFMINRFLSMCADTAHFAHAMGHYSNIPQDIQYQFYLGVIPTQRRFFQYQKAEEKNDNLKLIEKYFDCNPVRAKEILSILSEEQIQQISEVYENKVIKEKKTKKSKNK